MDTLITAVTALIEQPAVVAKSNTNEEGVKSFADSLSPQMSQANAEGAKSTGLMLPISMSGSNNSAPYRHAVYGKKLQTGEAELAKGLQGAVNEIEIKDSETDKKSSATTTDDVTGSQTSDSTTKVAANKIQNNVPAEKTGAEGVDGVSAPEGLCQVAKNSSPVRRLQTSSSAIEVSHHNVLWNRSKHSTARQSIEAATEPENRPANKVTDKPNNRTIHSVAAANTNQIAAIPIGGANRALVPFAQNAPSLGVSAATAGCDSSVTSQNISIVTTSTDRQRLQSTSKNGQSNISIPAAKTSAINSITTEPLAGDHGSAPQDKPGSEKLFLPRQNSDTCSKSQGAMLPATAAQSAVGANGFTIGAASRIAMPPGTAVTASEKGQGSSISDRMTIAHRETGRDYDVATAVMSLPAGGAHKTLLATQTTLEVAVPDGTQGWLKVRAEMVGGGAITASLSAESPSGQEALHRELPSLTAFLQQERIAVNTIVVHQGATRPMDGGQAGTFGGGMNGQQHGGGQGREKSHTFGAFAFDGSFGKRHMAAPSETRAYLSYGDNGSWLSVRA